MPGSFERMIALVNEFFDTRNDPDQISVSEEERQKLQQIHPATLSEYADDGGPIVWILLVPTTTGIIQQFVDKKISEKALLEQTPLNAPYDAIYLCSASVLPEYRGKGLAKKVTLDAIGSIRKDHDIKALFTWPFSREGAVLAQALADQLHLPLYIRK